MMKNITTTKNLTWSPEAERALELLENSDRPLFITGKAGTGKSTLLRYFVEHTGLEYAIVAPTGVAALNVGGQTIHSFFRFPHHPIHPSQVKKVSKKKRKLYENLDLLIIDEISMVRADMLDNIDVFLRKNGPTPGKPFGGVRMAFFGDLFQLPPVIAHEIEHQLMELLYSTPYFFSAYVLEKAPLQTINLEKIYRQNDADFLELLNAVRHNELDIDGLYQLNERYAPNFQPPKDEFFITLTATNKQASIINEKHMNGLEEKEYKYTAKREGNFPERTSPNDDVVRLRKGAQVMFIRNDFERRWVNGTLGKVIDMDESSVLVQNADDGLEYEVKPVEWELMKYNFNQEKRTIDTETLGTFEQLPLKPAWAITIHKSQGKTFDNVIIDTGRGAFASGQVYVALSRCTSLDGIVLKNRIRMREIQTDKEILKFALGQGI